MKEPEIRGMRLIFSHKGTKMDCPYDEVALVYDSRKGVLRVLALGGRINVTFGHKLSQEELRLIQRTVLRSHHEGVPVVDLDDLLSEIGHKRSTPGRVTPWTSEARAPAFVYRSDLATEGHSEKPEESEPGWIEFP